MRDTTWEKSLKNLFPKLKEHDDEAWNIVVSHYKKGLEICAYAIVENQADAEEVVQRVMITLMLKIDTIEDPERMTGFLRSTVHNTAVNYVSRGCYRFEANASDLSDNDSDRYYEFPDGDDPETLFYEKVYRQEIEDCLLAIGNKLAEPLVMKYILGLSAKEIAGRLHLSTSTVNGRIEMGKKKAREYLLKH